MAREAGIGIVTASPGRPAAWTTDVPRVMAALDNPERAAAVAAGRGHRPAGPAAPRWPRSKNPPPG
jgi:hypothetical protein